MTDVANESENLTGPLDEKKLIEYIAEKTRVAWEEKQPFFFSNVAPSLKRHGLNYREVTGDKSLLAWARDVHQDQWKIVRHPNQLSKVGTVPADSPFSFEEIEAANDGNEPIRSRKKPVVIRFLEELSKLDPDDLDKVNIPVSVIVKLLKV